MGNSSPEVGSSNKLDCVTGADFELENETEKFMYGLERNTTEIYKESQID